MRLYEAFAAVCLCIVAGYVAASEEMTSGSKISESDFVRIGNLMVPKSETVDDFRDWQISNEGQSLSGSVAKALYVATSEFLKEPDHEKKPDLVNFDVRVHETTSSVYLWFYPKREVPGTEWTFGAPISDDGVFVSYDINKADFSSKQRFYGE